MWPLLCGSCMGPCVGLAIEVEIPTEGGRKSVGDRSTMFSDDEPETKDSPSVVDIDASSNWQLSNFEPSSFTVTATANTSVQSRQHVEMNTRHTRTRIHVRESPFLLSNTAHSFSSTGCLGFELWHLRRDRQHLETGSCIALCHTSLSHAISTLELEPPIPASHKL